MYKLKKCRVLAMGIVVCLFILWGNSNNVLATESMMPEIEMGNTIDTEPSYLISDCEVSVDLIEKVDNEYVLKFILFNESSFDISNWTVVFESNYSIEQQEGFEIIEQNQIKHIRCLDDKKNIRSKEFITFEIKVISLEQIDVDVNYRVYGYYVTNENQENDKVLKPEECIDVIQYDIKTGEYTLERNDVEDIIKTQQIDMVVETNETIQNNIYSNEIKVEPFKIIGKDNRDPVDDVRETPYSAIVFLLVTYYDGTMSSGTGFVINDNYLATAAHVVYNSQTYTVYGIHSGGNSTQNWARRFTRDLYVLFMGNGWID